MQYLIVWLEWLLIGLCFFAFGAAVFSRLRPGRLRGLGILLSAGLPGAILLSLAGFTWWINNQGVRPLWLFPYAASLAGAYVLFAAIPALALKRKNDGLPRARVLLLLLFLLLALNALTFSLSNRAFAEGQREKARRLEAALPPFSPANPKPAENAAPPLLKAASLMKEIEGRESLRRAVDPDFDAGSAEAKELLARYQEPLDLIHRAAARPYFHYPDPVGRLVAMDGYPLSDATFLLDSARLLVLQAREFVRQGRPEQALNNLAQINRMGGWIRRCPHSLLNFVIGGGMQKQAFQGLECLLYDLSRTGAAISLTSWPGDEPGPEDNLHALDVEHIFSIRYQERTQGFLLESLLGLDLDYREEGGLRWYEQPFERALQALYAFFLQPAAMEREERIVAEARRLAVLDCGEAREQAETLVRARREELADPVFGDGSSLLFITSYSCRLKTWLRLERLALAAESFYRGHGRYPESLDALVSVYIPAVPSDPFDRDGGPLKMKPFGNGIVLYSNGTDWIDNGGSVQQAEGEPSDITFFLGEKPLREKSPWD